MAQLRTHCEPALSAAELAELDIGLRALEGLEDRAYGAEVDADLAAAVRIRGAALGERMAHRVLADLGYYALAAPDPNRQHNELPDAAFRAQDAIARLIRYVGGLEAVQARDAIAARRFGR